MYYQPGFGSEEMQVIREGLENGLSMEQVARYAKPEFIVDDMLIIRDGIIDGLSDEEIERQLAEFWDEEF